MNKRILKIIMSFIFFLLFIGIVNYSNSLTITEEGSTTLNVSSDMFNITNANGTNISTNSHYEFLAFWRNSDGTFSILYSGNRKAYNNHKAKTITIGGKEIDTLKEYTSLTIKDINGVTHTYNKNDNHYFVFSFDYSDELITGINIVLETGAGGFNVNANAKVKFLIKVVHNTDGTEEIDWDQSRGSVTEGESYTINNKTYDNYIYNNVIVTAPDSTTNKYTDTSVNVIGAEGTTTVEFYYESINTKRNIEVTKVWNDEGNSDKRPDKIRLILTEGEIETQNYYDLNVASESSHTFSVPKYDTNKNKINYNIIEKNTEGQKLKDYTYSVTGTMEEGLTITNTYKIPYISDSTIDLEGPDIIKDIEKKVQYNIKYKFKIDENYNGGSPQIKIVQYLPYEIDTSKNDYNLNDGVYNSENKTITWEGVYDISSKTITWNNGNTDQVEIENNEIIIKKDTEFNYSKEIIKSHNSNISSNVEGIITLDDDETNETEDTFTTNVQLLINIIINKKWENDTYIDSNNVEQILNIRPTTLSINLYDDTNSLIKNIDLTAENNWIETISNLPRYNTETLEEIEYTVKEMDELSSYEPKIDKEIEDDNLKIIITNTKINKQLNLPKTGGTSSIILNTLSIIFISISLVILKRLMKH